MEITGAAVPPPPRRGRLTVAIVVGLPLYGLVYAACYWLSVHFGLVPPDTGIAVIWLPSGLQVAVLLLLPDRRWWPVVVGVGVVAELTSGWWQFGSPGQSLWEPHRLAVVAAFGNAGEAMLAAQMCRWIGGRRVPDLHRTREALGLAIAAVVAPAANALLVARYGVHFRTYWTGDLTGIVALTPAVLCLVNEARVARGKHRVLARSRWEVAGFAVTMIGALLLVFTRTNATVADASIVALLWPVLAWAAFRIGPTTTALAGLGVIVVADLFTRVGQGPYGAVAAAPGSRVAALQGVLVVLVLSAEMVAAGLLEREQAETALASAVEVDPITGLLTLDAARERVERLRAPGSLTAVLVLDLDDFADVNEHYGRDIGNQCLRQVGERLALPLRTEDVIARMAGDSFLVAIGRLAGARGAQVTAERVLATLAAPLVVDQRVISVSACSGLALVEPRETVDRALSRAQAAVAGAKSRGPGRSASLDAEEYGRLDEARRLQSELHRAISAAELEAHYQPIVDTRTGRMVAVESLLRWRHPDRGLLTAGAFIPGAETSGLVVALDDWVLRQSVADLARMRAEPGLEDLILFVNVSARTLAEPDSSGRIRGVLREHGTSPASVVIEVTETALVDDSETGRRAAAELAGAGVSLAIDDFGQGHASLARLRALPISVVKIDHSFVSGMGAHEVDDAVVRWVTTLAKQLRMSTVAEGVESQEQLRRLAAIGVDFAQGFGIAMPMPCTQLLSSVTADGQLTSAS